MEHDRVKAAAMETAAEIGGNFLEKIGKTDLSSMTYDEYMSYVRVVCLQYDKTFDDLHADVDFMKCEQVSTWVRSDDPVRRGVNMSLDLDDEIPF